MSIRGTIQVDLDGLWTNLKYYGKDVELAHDPVFMSSIPRFLDLFERFNIKATFFVIGKDLEINEKKSLVREISKAGHEIANHTYSHPFGFRELSHQHKVQEIADGERIIEKTIGKKVVGFKSPGYDSDINIMKILSERNYLYDSSVIPTAAYPTLMMINRLVHGGVKRTHGPRWDWFLAPNVPYHPSSRSVTQRGNLNIHELPCTVMPFLRLPFHATFINKLGYHYFNLSYHLCKKFGVPLNFEFHAVDLADDERLLDHVKKPLDARIITFKKILLTLTKGYTITTSEQLIRGLAGAI